MWISMDTLTIVLQVHIYLVYIISHTYSSIPSCELTYWKVGDPANCAKYYECASGIQYHRNCAAGTYWNYVLNDHCSVLVCTPPSSGLTTTTTNPTTTTSTSSPTTSTTSTSTSSTSSTSSSTTSTITTSTTTSTTSTTSTSTSSTTSSTSSTTSSTSSTTSSTTLTTSSTSTSIIATTNPTSSQTTPQTSLSTSTTTVSSVSDTTGYFGTTPASTSGNIAPECNTSTNCEYVCVAQQSLTEEELQAEIQRIREELRINTKHLSSYIRTKSSAGDDRPSAAVIGYLGIIVLIVILSVIVLFDLPHIFICLSKFKRSIRVADV